MHAVGESICLYNNYVFWYECKNYLEEGLGTAVDDRRHGIVTHLAHAVYCICL